MSTTSTSTSTSLPTLSGLATGVDTTALINAIVAQKGQGVARLTAQQTLNNTKVTTLNAMRTELSTLTTSLAVIQDGLNSRTVTSTDANNINVTATGTGAASGNFDVTVHTVATKGRISSTLDANGLTTNLAVASPTDSVNSNIFTPGTPASFAIQGTDGVIKTITLTDSTNTLNGLKDAINASGAGVTATVMNMGKGAKPYQLVLTAKATGTGTTNGVVSLVDITNMGTDGSGNPVAGNSANNLGIAAGTVDSLTTPTKLTGGLTSATSGASAVDATFSVNGIELTRTTNTVSDVADGMVFTLKQGGQTGTSTLTVAPNTAAATADMQDFITKYNKLLTDYKTASTSTQNTDGSIAQAPLAGDPTTRSLMNNLRTTLGGLSAGLPSSATYKALSSLGITHQADGTLSMNTITFTNALNNDLASVSNLFKYSGTSTNSVVALSSAGTNAPTGAVDFAITKDANGVLWGTLTQNSTTTAPIQVTNGLLTGNGAFAGLNLSVIGTGSGTITLSRGVGQAAADLMSSFTSVNGAITTSLNNIALQNKGLAAQIQRGQALLDSETTALKKQFADMEAVVGQMKAAAGSLTGA
jgi:flagellar hook-associated protein 2